MVDIGSFETPSGINVPDAPIGRRGMSRQVRHGSDRYLRSYPNGSIRRACYAPPARRAWARRVAGTPLEHICVDAAAEMAERAADPKRIIHGSLATCLPHRETATGQPLWQRCVGCQEMLQLTPGPDYFRLVPRQTRVFSIRAFMISSAKPDRVRSTDYRAGWSKWLGVELL